MHMLQNQVAVMLNNLQKKNAALKSGAKLHDPPCIRD
jgi:hypothetical protein